MEKTLKDYIFEQLLNGASADDIVKDFTSMMNEAEAEFGRVRSKFPVSKIFGPECEEYFYDIEQRVRDSKTTVEDVATLIVEMLVKPYYDKKEDTVLTSASVCDLLLEDVTDILNEYLKTMHKTLSVAFNLETSDFKMEDFFDLFK